MQNLSKAIADLNPFIIGALYQIIYINRTLEGSFIATFIHSKYIRLRIIEPRYS